LKVDSSKATNVMLQAKVKNLEANLEKAIGTYDDTLAHNHKLKNEIDMLRREKKNFLETQKILDERIKKYEDESA
jgi:cell division protein FtsB